MLLFTLPTDIILSLTLLHETFSGSSMIIRCCFKGLIVWYIVERIWRIQSKDQRIGVKGPKETRRRMGDAGWYPMAWKHHTWSSWNDSGLTTSSVYVSLFLASELISYYSATESCFALQVYLGSEGALDVEGKELPRLVYVSREKRPGYNHHKKAGAMNALVSKTWLNLKFSDPREFK